MSTFPLNFPSEWKSIFPRQRRLCVFQGEDVTVIQDVDYPKEPVFIATDRTGNDGVWLSKQETKELRNVLDAVLNEPIQVDAPQSVQIEPGQPLIINVQVVTSK